MSYCVNCGVRLENSLAECPLCNTPVINPRALPYNKKTPPFPKEKGTVDVVKRKDLAILLSVVLGAAALACGLLNLFVYTRYLWSIPVIGVCLVLWVLAIPAVIYTRLPIYLSLFLDGVSIGLYLYLISFMTGSRRWLWELGLPIDGLVTVLAILYLVLYRKVSSSFLASALYFFAEIPVLCIVIELLIRRYMGDSPALTWSAVVLTACVIIDIAFITLLSRARLRNAVRRRLHF